MHVRAAQELFTGTAVGCAVVERRETPSARYGALCVYPSVPGHDLADGKRYMGRTIAPTSGIRTHS